MFDVFDLCFVWCWLLVGIIWEIVMKYVFLIFFVVVVFLFVGCVIFELWSIEVVFVIFVQWFVSMVVDVLVILVVDIGWCDFFVDLCLQVVIGQLLDNNCDLCVVVFNVECVCVQYCIQCVDCVLVIVVQGQMICSGGDVLVIEQFSVNLGVVEFELDLFGCVCNFS